MLSVVIPTIKYRETLDEAISSCIENLECDFQIVVSINATTDLEFRKSRYWKNTDINWNCLGKNRLRLDESLNRAISFVKTEWIFVLADDDLILPGFLNEFDLIKEDKFSLYATRTKIINENNQTTTPCWYKYENSLSMNEIINEFFLDKIHHHLSLLVFSKQMYDSVKGFLPTGYPNGCYTDTTFNLHLFSRCSKVTFSKKIVFARRESSFHMSSQIYMGREVNIYLNKVMHSMLSDSVSRKVIRKLFPTNKKLFLWLIYNRYLTDFDKLKNPIYKKNYFDRLKLFIAAIFIWNIELNYKVKIIMHHILKSDYKFNY